MNYDLPALLQIGWLLAVFGIALFIFHILLVYWLKLNKKAWKRVDYVWLAVGTLGILSATERPREALIKNLLESAESRLVFTYGQVSSAISFGLSPAVCVSVNDSPLLTEAERFEQQRGFDVACQWFKDVSVAAKAANQRPTPIKLESEAPAFDAIPLGAPRFAVMRLREAIQDHNDQIPIIEKLQKLRSHNVWESTLSFLAPFLIAIALALRITKVTGELRLEA